MTYLFFCGSFPASESSQANLKTFIFLLEIIVKHRNHHEINGSHNVFLCVEIKEMSKKTNLSLVAKLTKAANDQYKKNNLDKALELYEEALRAEKTAPSAKTPDLVPLINSLALVYYKKNDLDKALELHKQAAEIERKALPNELSIAG